MAKRAQTELAVLGALTVEPMTGYQVRQAIVTVLGHFWHESFGQIYPCLADLEERGLIARTGADRGDPFSITPAGRDELRARLIEPPERQRPRNGTLLRVFLGPNLSEGELEDLLDSTEAEALARQAGFAAIRAEIAQETQYAAQAPYWLATVSAGEHATRATLDWVAETRATLLGSRRD